MRAPAGLLALALASTPARAQDRWNEGGARAFVSSDSEVGWLYARPNLAAGFGRPHHAWAGLELSPGVNDSAVNVYAGARGRIPHLDLQLGARVVYPFTHTLRPVQDRYNRLDLESEDGPKANYRTWEAQLAGDVPLPGGRAFALFTGYYVVVAPENEGLRLYEETLKVIVEPPWVWRARLGYLLEFGRDDAVKLGPAAEVLGLVGRDRVVVRAGGIASVDVSSFVAVQATFIPVIASPDTLGVAGADFGRLGLRLRWATK